MVVAVMCVRFNFASGAERDRRKILRSAVDRLRARKAYSVANITEDPDPRSGEIGVTWVGKSVAEADSALDLALQLLERAEGIIVDVDREIVHWEWVD